MKMKEKYKFKKDEWLIRHDDNQMTIGQVESVHRNSESPDEMFYYMKNTRGFIVGSRWAPLGNDLRSMKIIHEFMK